MRRFDARNHRSTGLVGHGRRRVRRWRALPPRGGSGAVSRVSVRPPVDHLWGSAPMSTQDCPRSGSWSPRVPRRCPSRSAVPRSSTGSTPGVPTSASPRSRSTSSSRRRTPPTPTTPAAHRCCTGSGAAPTSGTASRRRTGHAVTVAARVVLIGSSGATAAGPVRVADLFRSAGFARAREHAVHSAAAVVRAQRQARPAGAGRRRRALRPRARRLLDGLPERVGGVGRRAAGGAGPAVRRHRRGARRRRLRPAAAAAPGPAGRGAGAPAAGHVAGAGHDEPTDRYAEDGGRPGAGAEPAARAHGPLPAGRSPQRGHDASAS